MASLKITTTSHFFSFALLAMCLLVTVVHSAPAEEAAQAAAAAPAAPAAPAADAAPAVPAAPAAAAAPAADAAPAASAPVPAKADAPKEPGQTDMSQQPPAGAAPAASAETAANNNNNSTAPADPAGKALPPSSGIAAPQNFAAGVICQPIFLLAMIICAISMRSFA